MSERLESSLSIPPIDCTNHCMDGPCDCSGVYRVMAYSKESVDARIAELTAERDSLAVALTETQQALALEQRKNAWLQGIVFEHVGTDAANVDPDGYAALADVSGRETSTT